MTARPRRTERHGKRPGKVLFSCWIRNVVIGAAHTGVTQVTGDHASLREQPRVIEGGSSRQRAGQGWRRLGPRGLWGRGQGREGHSCWCPAADAWDWGLG